MPFEQHFHGDVENVYNVEGDLILTRTSSIDDFARAMKQIRDEVTHLQGVDAGQAAVMSGELAAVMQEAHSSHPPRERIASRLQRVGEILLALGNGLPRAVELGQTLMQAASWAKALLGGAAQ